MKMVNPYLFFTGNAEEAFQFYRSVFGGEFSMLMRKKDVPGMEVPEKQGEKIMHIALPLKTGQVLMGNDVPEHVGIVMGNNAYISIHADSEAEGAELFRKLVDGGKSGADFQKQFWGAWHGNLVDRFGACWMINYDPQ